MTDDAPRPAEQAEPAQAQFAQADLEWGEDGAPRSRRFGDVYYSLADGLAESRAVYLHGCGLPEAWRGRTRFVAGELGFGSGLNIVALLDLWARERPPGGRLQVFSVEAFPMSAAEAARALDAWPELAATARLLLDRWPGRARGFHRVDLPELDAVLDVAVMDAAEALAAWDGAADAWFLDGFSPALNPGMWSDEVLALVAARSAPGARAATFTVAGAVRRGLAAQGFAVDKRPGHGRKRERLEAVWPGEPAAPAAPARVAVVGAGIAGASLVRAFRALGAAPLAIEAEHPGAGASGNPAALVTPRLDAGGGRVAALFAHAFRRAVDLISRTAPQAVIARGVLQVEAADRDASRFDRVAASDLFEPGALARRSPAEVAAALGEVEGGRGGLWFADALVVEPARLIAAWLDGIAPVRARVARLERDGGVWRLFDAAGALVAEAEIVCLAGGLATRDLVPDLPLSPVRGQVAWTAPPTAAFDGVPAAWGGYAAPTRDGGVLFGATHDRGDLGLDRRPADDRRNLALLAKARPALARTLDEAFLEARVGVRAATPGHVPLAGTAGEPGLFVLAGLGGRGFSTAPLLAEHVAALALGAPSPLPRGLSPAGD